MFRHTGTSLSIVAFAAAASAFCPSTSRAEPPQASAVEVQRGQQLFRPAPADDRPHVFHPMPRLDTIPPMPMPVYNPTPAGQQPGNLISSHDQRTGETRTIPIDTVPGITSGQTNGGLPLVAAVGSEQFELRGLGTMTAISTRNTFPWSTCCKVALSFNNGSGGQSWFVCSGTMIDPSVCLVAGHCVYNHGNSIPDGFATSMYVFPGWDGNGNIIPPSGAGSDTSYNDWGYGASTYIAAGGSWVSSANTDQDYGFVGLNRPVGSLTGYFGTAWGYDCSTIQSRVYYNASYPAESCGQPGLHNGQTMYYWSGTIDSCPNNQMQINTTPGCFTAVWGGMSGSSMYYIDGSGNRLAHAVCSTSNRSTSAWYCKLDQVGYNYIYNMFIPEVHGSTFDLAALNCNFTPTSIQAGATTALENFLMVNTSNASASGNWTYRVYLSQNDSIGSGDTLLSTQSVNWSFGPSGAVRVNMVPVTIPVNTPPGTYWLGVALDPSTDGNTGNNATNNWDAVKITVTAAAPGNDQCANAWPATEGSYSGNTNTANTDGSCSCGFQSGNDVWFAYTASATGVVNINTCGSSFDTVLSVHSGCPGTSSNQIACNDDSWNGGNSACGTSGLQSGLNLNTTAGQTYLIRVAGYNGITGTYLLNIIAIPPANDNCANAIAITPGTYTGSTGFANTDGAASCGYSASAPDVWYAITPATDGEALLDTCGSSYDTVLSVHTGCPGTLDNQIGCNDDAYPYTPCSGTVQSAAHVRVLAGHTYYVRVAGYAGSNGAYVLHYNLDAISNDTCDTATPVGIGTYAFNTTGATTDGPTEANCGFCCNDLQINQDIWFSITPTCGRTITIDTIGSSFDTKLAVYVGCPYSNNTAVVCNDDLSVSSRQSMVTLVPTGGVTYSIRVGGYTTAAGAGVLNIKTCLADFNCSGSVTIQDIFDFLTAWFAKLPSADFNNSGTVSVQDIFDFLTAWFAGCH